MAQYTAKYFKFSWPSEGVLLVELARPPANAFHEEAWTELNTVFDAISADERVRVVVLASSNPKMFTAGLDVKALTTSLDAPPMVDGARAAMSLRDEITRFQHAVSSLERCSHPVIAAMHGIAYGLAIDMASACDIRYASSDVKCSIKEVDIGLAADVGTLARFPQIVGNGSLARELALTARIFDAAEAHQIGFVSKVVPGGRHEVIQAALETARLIATKSPVAVYGTKRLMIHGRDNSVSDNLEYTAIWNASMLQTKDLMAALTSNKTKRPAKFDALPAVKGKL